MANLVEVLLKAIDGVTPVVKNIDKETAKANKAMAEQWAKTGGSIQAVGVATMALGAGIELMARVNAPLLESTRRLADYLDMDSKAMQQLVIDTSNASFELEDVLALMETGARLGLNSAESLKQYAEFWDMVSDATGESSVQLAESGVALKSLGIAAGEEGKALNAFGFIQRNTTMDIKEFIDMVGRLAPEMKEMGIGVNEAAVIMGILQREMGLTSRTALAEFRTAVTESNGDVEKLKEILGITGEMFDTYSQKVAESSDVISENARRNNELITPLQEVQHWLGEVKYKMGDFIQGAAEYAPLLTGMGSAMTIVGTIMKSSFYPTILLATKAVWAFTASILANPLTFWVGAIGLVITSLVLLWKNWENITEWIEAKVDVIVSKFEWLGDKIKWVAEKLGIYKEKVVEVSEATGAMGASAFALEESLNSVKESSEGAREAVAGLTEGNVALGESLDGVAEKAALAASEIYGYTDQATNDYVAASVKAGDSWEDFYAFWALEAERTAGEINQTVTTVIDKMGVAHKVWTDIKDEVKGAESNLYRVLDASGKIIGLQTGNILSQAQKEVGVTLVKQTTATSTSGNSKYNILDSKGNIIGTTPAMSSVQASNYLEPDEISGGLTLQKLHEGSWKVKTEKPGGEGIAVLKDTEVVSQSESGGWKGATNQINLEIKAGAFQFNANKIDENSIRNSGKIIFDELYSQFRAHGIVLARG
jgi:uncharacterized protein YoxC